MANGMDGRSREKYASCLARMHRPCLAVETAIIANTVVPYSQYGCSIM